MTSVDPWATFLDELGSLPMPAALQALRARVADDLSDFRRDVGWRLPSSLESVSGSDIRQHLGAFLERAFRAWAERENSEVKQALGLLAERAHDQAAEVAPEDAGRAGSGPDSRLLRPSFEVSTFAVDASVVAALALGVGTLFANAAVGGLFLLAAPTLASFGKDHSERRLRARAAESAMKAVDEAVASFGVELNRLIDEFARRLPNTSP